MIKEKKKISKITNTLWKGLLLSVVIDSKKGRKRK